jgi:hypothetical protein
MSHIDFDGDGRDDILWRNDSGLLTQWLASAGGGWVGNSNGTINVPLFWDVIAIGDFTGDGRSDILWRSTGGTVAEWLGTAGGGFTAGPSLLGPVGWDVVATGDFNGDGRDDILWGNNDGHVTEWLGQRDGGWADNAANASSFVSGWGIVATGDFNGDGRDDILWRNSTGTISDWLATPSGGFTMGSGINVPNDWFVAGTGDFNGDGRDDILWYNFVTRQVTDWLTQVDGGWVDNPATASLFVDAGWQVYGTGDYNADGRADVLWRGVDGQISEWSSTQVGGFAVAGTAALASPDWHIEIYNPSPWDY